MTVTVSDIYNDVDYDEISAMFFEEELHRKHLQFEADNAGRHGYAYYLDNCGDGKWYCDHCLQRDECGKRIV